MDNFSPKPTLQTAIESEMAFALRHKGTGYVVIKPGRLRREKWQWFVVVCACGWESPLCTTGSRAKELLYAHRTERKAEEWSS